MEKICVNCKQKREHHAKGLCYSCYKKLNYKPKTAKCNRCKLEKQIHAKNLCAACYNSLFHLDKNRAYYQRKTHKIDLKTHKKLTKSCALCDFNKIVDIHHLDFNKNNNNPENLVGLCPNHKRMANNNNFRYEILQELKNKGFDVHFLNSSKHKK